MQILAQKIVNLSKHIILKLKFLIETQNYKCRLAKNIDIVNKLYYSSSEDFENNILYKLFNFYIMREINTEDFQIRLRAIDRVNIT